jgi:hypothetical protein
LRNIYSKSEALCNKFFTKILMIFSIIFILLSLSLDGFNYLFFNLCVIFSVTVNAVYSSKGRISDVWWSVTVIVSCVSLFLRIFCVINFGCFLLSILTTLVAGKAAGRISAQLYYDNVIKPAHIERKKYRRQRSRYRDQNRR